MRRRTAWIILTLALGILAAPLADAQQPGKMTRIGFLSPTSPTEISHLVDAFREGLRDLGWVDGKNIGIEYRWAHGRFERLADVAADLVRLKVDVILAFTSPGITAAKRATNSVPIVMVGVGDPVGTGFVTTLTRPGGNITGVSNISRDLSGKVLVDLYTVSQVRGHKSLAMSARYSHLSPAHQRQALERLATREPEVGYKGGTST